jgi:hypothetical protein
LGRAGPLTDELLDAAVGASVVEASDLDWKSALPPAKGLPQTGFPNDVATTANSGGGLIVFGIHESQKAATEWGDFVALVRSAAEAPTTTSTTYVSGSSGQATIHSRSSPPISPGYPHDDSSTPLHTCTAVDMSVNAAAAEFASTGTSTT